MFKKSLRIISCLALVMLITPSVLVYAGRIDLATSKNWMALATFIWFATAPFWMDKNAQ